MINKDYLKNLNEAQKEAVMHLEGPLLIVAGAGSGKTKVLTSRIVHIIRTHKAFSNQILAVTFTNKAAKEMQNRVSKILGSSAEYSTHVDISTFSCSIKTSTLGVVENPKSIIFIPILKETSQIILHIFFPEALPSLPTAIETGLFLFISFKCCMNENVKFFITTEFKLESTSPFKVPRIPEIDLINGI